jgi:hypothetical protein
MTKHKPKKPKKRPVSPPVREVVLPSDGIVRVVTAPGILPVVVSDPGRRVVEIVPVKKTRSWWAKFFAP